MVRSGRQSFVELNIQEERLKSKAAKTPGDRNRKASLRVFFGNHANVFDNRKVALRQFKCVCLLSAEGNLVLDCSLEKTLLKNEVNEDGSVAVSAPI